MILALCTGILRGYISTMWRPSFIVAGTCLCNALSRSTMTVSYRSRVSYKYVTIVSVADTREGVSIALCSNPTPRRLTSPSNAAYRVCLPHNLIPTAAIIPITAYQHSCGMPLIQNILGQNGWRLNSHEHESCQSVCDVYIPFEHQK